MSESKIIEPISFPKNESHPKAWGSEEWIVNNDSYCLKFLNFKKGASFSYHFHLNKLETWYVLRGSLKLEYFDLANADKMVTNLKVGSIIHIPPGNPHKLTALEDSLIVEVSTTHREEDSYRIGKGDSQK